MERKSRMTILLGLILAEALLGGDIQSTGNRDFVWMNELEEGRTVAAREGKPLFIVFR